MKIKEIKKITLEDNEYLFIKLPPDELSLEQVNNVRTTLDAIFGDNAKRIMIHSIEMELTKVKVKESAMACKGKGKGRKGGKGRK